MLKKVKIKNFQSHKDTELEFCEGINVITGESDSGKSAILKSMNWLISAYPFGSEFASNFAKDDKETKVELDFDDCHIERIRRDRCNYYILGEGEDAVQFDSTGYSVPEEISSLINMQDQNIQSQHNNYFMLQNTSPGDIAKTFNKVAGLEVVDLVSKDLKKTISKAKDRLEDTELELIKAESNLKKFDGFDRVLVVFNRLEQNILRRDYKREERKALIILSNRLKEIDNEIEEINIWLSVEDEINNVIKECNILEAENSEKNKIEELCKNLEVLDKELLKMDSFLLVEDKINNLKETLTLQNKDIREAIETKRIKDVVEFTEEEIQKISNKIEEKQKLLNSYYLELQNCPTCGKSLTVEETKKIFLEGSIM